MSSHRNAKLGLAGRYALVCAIGEGLSLKAAAAAFSWKVLKRAGISRPPKPAREPANRYEWPCPRDLHRGCSQRVLRRRLIRERGRRGSLATPQAAICTAILLTPRPTTSLRSWDRR